MIKILILILFLFNLQNCLSDDNIKDPVFLQNYEDIKNTDEKIILIFSADWCKYCQYLRNDIDSLKLNMNNFLVCVVNSDERRDLFSKYKIKSLPTSIVIEQNKEKSRISGYSQEKYSDWLNKNIK